MAERIADHFSGPNRSSVCVQDADGDWANAVDEQILSLQPQSSRRERAAVHRDKAVGPQARAKDAAAADADVVGMIFSVGGPGKWDEHPRANSAYFLRRVS